MRIPASIFKGFFLLVLSLAPALQSAPCVDVGVGSAQNRAVAASSSNPKGTALGAVSAAKPQDALDVWYLRSSSPAKSVRFAGNRFYGLGPGGLLLTSSDGADWTTQNSGTTNDLHGVANGTAYSGAATYNLTVVVGSKGTILTSTDGVTWNRVSVTGQDLDDVCYTAQGRFVATATASYSGQPNVYYSASGTNWTGVSFASNPDTGLPFLTSAIMTAGPYSVTAGGSMFEWNIWRSADGITWQNMGSSSQVVGGISYGKGRLIVVGWEGWPCVSTNRGASWFFSPSSVITNTQPSSYTLPMVGGDIGFGNGTFLVTRSFLTNGFLITEDGVSWTNRNLFLGSSVESVAYGNDTFVITASGACPAGIYQSLNVATPVMNVDRTGSANSLRLSISGKIGNQYRLQTSSDLANWNDHITYTNVVPIVTFQESVSDVTTQVFYRVVSP